MAHPLREKVRSVNRRVNRLVLLHALAWVVAAVALVAFLLGLADYLFRFGDFGVRLIAWLGLVAVLGAGCYYLLWPALAFNPTDLDIARRIERYFPQLADRLSSALAFLDQPEGDPTAGSAALRRAVVAEAVSAVESLDLGEAIDSRRPRRAAAAALLVLLVVGVVCVFDRASASLAARRLVAPWSSAVWPRRHQLAFETPPERLAVGDDFEISLIDENGRLPETVKIQYWLEGDPEDRILTKEMRLLNDRMVHRLENVTRAFQFRAYGGDDNTMPWRALDVAEPARVSSLKLKILPPAYTGWPAMEGGTQIRVLEGSRLELTGLANKRLATALLRAGSGESQQNVSGRVLPGSRGFAFPADAEKPWVAWQSLSLALEVADEDGVKGGSESRFEITVVPDRQPTVSLEAPAPNTFVTAGAVVPLRALVKDDLGIASAELRYLRSDQSELGEQTITLYPAAGEQAAPPVGSLADAAERGASRLLNHPWNVGRLQGLKPGVAITYYVLAADHRSQTGQCLSQRLVIISAEELQDRLAQRQAAILAQLADVLKAQRASRAQTRSLEIQLAEARLLSKNDLDQLQSAELNQREVQRLLQAPAVGVEAQIAELLADMASNRVDNPDAQRRMQALQQTVRALSAETLPRIASGLLEALKTARVTFSTGVEGPTADEVEAAAQPIGEAGRHQDQVIATLEKLLGELSQWESYRRYSREISQIRREQDEIRKQTDPLRLKTLGKDAADLSAQERADLKRLAELQYELGRQFDKLQGRMREAQTRLRESEPLAAETLSDALETARRLALAGQMRDSGASLERNQISQAARSQDEIGRGLDELLDALANRREHELGRLVKKLREAAGELEQIRERQGGLQKKLEAAARSKPVAGSPAEQQRKAELQRLAKDEQSLAEEVRRLARRLQRLQAEQAGDLAAEAGEKLSGASQASGQEDAEGALERAQEGSEQLAQAQEQLEQRLRTAEQDLLREQVARLEQEIGGFVAREQGLLDRTREIESLRDPQGRLAREPLQSLLGLAREQRALAGETTAKAEQLAESPAFELALRGAAREMLRASTALDARESGDASQQAQLAALNRLNQLLEALKPAAQDPAENPEDNSGGQGGGNQGGQPPAGRLQALAELKLLKLLQQEINRRTIELEENRQRDEGLSDEDLARLEDLAREQGRLADLIAKLARQPEAALPEDNLDSLPKLERPATEEEPQ